MGRGREGGREGGDTTTNQKRGREGRRTYLVHRASGGHHGHDILAATISADGEPAADDLAQGGHVGGDAEVLL